MSTIAPVPSIQHDGKAPASQVKPVPRRCDVTRYMCASIFLGHDKAIRKNLRAFAADRHHAAAVNYGLNVRLLARVLDFFDQRKFRFALWHGPLGLFIFFVLISMYIAGGEEAQPMVILIMVVAALLLAIPEYRQFMRNRYEHPLRHFSRATYDPEKAMSAFQNSRGKLEREIASHDPGGNTTVYGGFEPFTGEGGALGNWSLVVDTRKGKEGELPVKFSEQELEDAIQASFDTLALPGLEIKEHLFIHGCDVGHIQELLPDRFGPPHQTVTESTMSAFRHSDSHDARVYKSISAWSWNDQVRISFFYRTIFQGPMLYIEAHSRVLHPVAATHREIDNLTQPSAGKKFSTFIGLVLITPVLCVSESFGLLLRMRDASLLRKLEKEEKKKIEEQARYNYGSTASLRESFSALIYDHYFEKSDRDLYLTTIEKQLLDSILAFLESKNVDTSDLKEERTYIINSGLIVHGGLQTSALAVGEQAQAMAGKKPKAKGTKAGGKAA
jgi:hypothetical protein